MLHDDDEEPGLTYSLAAVGFGTWQAAPGEVAAAVEEALKQGYALLV